MTSLHALERDIAAHGFAFVPGARMTDLLRDAGPLGDLAAFSASWDDLALDTYMADGGRYRRRRHAAFAVGRDGTTTRKPHQPHYQTLEYNPIHGGVARWFEPLRPDIGAGATLRTILAFCRGLFGALAGAETAWHVEVHQFRIEARSGEDGRPTPEGLHRDGVDYVLVLLVHRHNIVSGETTIHALDRRLLGSFTLTDPLDAALVDDARVYHGVTPVAPLDRSAQAYRDVLVVTFRKEPAAG